MAIHIHEFLYRGRPEGSAEEPAWHLIVASIGKDNFGSPTRAERTLNMAQAKEAGWELPKIIAAINADLMRECEALKAVNAEEKQKSDQAKQEIETLRGERDALAAAVEAQEKVLAANAGRASADVARFEAEIEIGRSLAAEAAERIAALEEELRRMRSERKAEAAALNAEIATGKALAEEAAIRIEAAEAELARTKDRLTAAEARAETAEAALMTRSVPKKSTKTVTVPRGATALDRAKKG